MSSTHIGWGAIRLEPTCISLGEAAAYAIVEARRQDIPPARLDVDALVRLLAVRRVMLSFFNDVEVDPREPWVPDDARRPAQSSRRLPIAVRRP